MSFVDSICIKVLNHAAIIYGKGNRLILLTGKKQIVNNIQPYDKIHHISFIKQNEDAYKVVCSAGREVLVTNVIDNKFCESVLFKISDWISSIKILENESIIVMTAHSLVSLIKIVEGKPIIETKLRCEENSTLYCSQIQGSCWNNLTFFGGTALGELLVWRKINEKPHIIHRQFLHNGVIFSIDYYNNYLLTSSDDRSLKVHKISFDNNSMELKEIKQLFGHTSRVFTGKSINFNDGIYFVSTGEDSNVCIWSENGELLSKKNVCSSGVIWNFDYQKETETIITCSSTGKLNKFKLREILFQKLDKISINSKANPAKIEYYEDSLIILDSDMNLHLKSPGKSSMKIEQTEENVRKFVATDLYENRLFLAAKSSVLVYEISKERNLTFMKELDIKNLLKNSVDLNYLRSIHSLSKSRIFISDANGLCLVLNIEHESIERLLKIPQSSEPWTTAVKQIDNIWLVADRVGNLFLFKDNERVEILNPIQKLWKLHGQLGVTNIITQNDGFIKTTGNDGTVKTLFIDKDEIEIRQCQRTLVNWIEKVCIWREKEFLLGFNDNYFVIANKRQIIYEHRCGGRHRHWDVSYDNIKNLVTFTYIQKKEINSVQFFLSDFSFDVDDDVLWHVKECNVMKIVDGNVLISGGEDTLLKLTSFEAIGNEIKFKEMLDINSQISSIKTIATWKDQNELLIISAGGRAQITVTRIFNMKYAKEEVNFMLTNSLENGNSKESTLDPETRFTCISVDKNSSKVYVACSDGFIRVLNLTRTNDGKCMKLELFLEHFYGKCLLQLHLIGEIILTMATDGIVCFWKPKKDFSNLKLIKTLKHNQSGINCFDVFNKGNGNYVIGTSGDDMEIHITKFVIESEKIEVQETIFTSLVHTAQVTGLKFLSEKIFFTTSIDQTICKLKIEEEIKILDRKFICIADVKGFEFTIDKIFAYGAGLETLPVF
ncbi:CLUMA_CG007519, isoform A [Clunio marinus]|uniref:tRNA (34-2'-O)-methyltransferase regulator WDR6 n=1 Tax=Clunio marinus TaxID=568069 RepID=A0A1J1I6G0_9DIPT|nr:CLUMA_CG007519, isoform A [Clunio marinus]